MSKFKEGDRVILPANPEEDLSEERGTIIEDEGDGMYVVDLDEEFITDPDDDGIREVHEDDIKPEAQ